MKKAIVTGATGFIGKFLVRELVKQNVEVIAVVRRGTKNLNTINALPVKIVECNIADSLNKFCKPILMCLIALSRGLAPPSPLSFCQGFHCFFLHPAEISVFSKVRVCEA